MVKSFLKPVAISILVTLVLVPLMQLFAYLTMHFSLEQRILNNPDKLQTIRVSYVGKSYRFGDEIIWHGKKYDICESRVDGNTLELLVFCDDVETALSKINSDSFPLPGTDAAKIAFSHTAKWICEKVDISLNSDMSGLNWYPLWNLPVSSGVYPKVFHPPLV